METILAFIVLVSLIGVPICLLLFIIRKIRKKPAKKMLIMAGLSLLVFVAVMSVYPNTDEKDTVSDASISDTPIIPIDDGADRTEESHRPNNTSTDNNAKAIDNGLEFDELSNFSDGVAWVRFTQAGDQVGLVNKQGKMVWSSDSFLQNTSFEERSTFKDGLGYCLLRSGEKKSYLILDSSGNVTFTRDYENGNFKILGYGDGIFLVAEHTLNFEVDEWKFGGIDKSGNTMIPFKAYEKTPPLGFEPVDPPSGDEPDPNLDYQQWFAYQEQLEAYNNYVSYPYTPEKIYFDDAYGDNCYHSCNYLGEGVFQINMGSYGNWYVLLNINSQSIIYTDNPSTPSYSYTIKMFITGFENDKATVICQDRNGKNMICTMWTDGKIVFDVENGPLSDKVWNNLESYSEGLVFIPYGQWATGVTGAYCNLQGEPVIEFPEYNGKREYTGSPFQDGYALITVIGKDGASYFTVIDKAGNQMFDLKSGFHTVSLSSDGKYVSALESGSSNLILFDTNGYPLVTIHDIGNHRGHTFQGEVADGVIRVTSSSGLQFYVVIDTMTTIGKYVYTGEWKSLGGCEIW